MAENPMTRDDCWLCDGCGEVEAISAHGVDVTVGCPVCIQNDEQWVRGRAEAERDALAAHVERLKPTLEDFARGQGICCCGDDMSRHTINDGHAPVDSGWYALDQYMSQAPTTSLGRRDAEMRKEGAISALIQAAVEMRESNDRENVATVYGLADHLEACARSIRRQSKETPND